MCKLGDLSPAVPPATGIRRIHFVNSGSSLHVSTLALSHSPRETVNGFRGFR